MGFVVGALSQTTVAIERSTGSYALNGTFAPAVGQPTLELGVVAVVQPGGHELNRNPEGQGSDRTIEVYVETGEGLTVGSREAGRRPDVIIWPDGSVDPRARYQVEWVEPWDGQGYQYARARGEVP